MHCTPHEAEIPEAWPKSLCFMAEPKFGVFVKILENLWDPRQMSVGQLLAQ